MNDSGRGVRGFSLVELLVALAIGAVLIAVGWPKLAALAPIYRLEGASRSLAADLQKARFRAIAENQCFQVNFDATNKTYRFGNKASASSCGTTGYTYGSYRKVDDANALTVSVTADPTFNARGAASASVITLTNRSGTARTIGVRVSGQVYVQ